MFRCSTDDFAEINIVELCRTALGRRVFNVVMSARGGPEFNDLFLPGRMAYSIDLEADDEIPTTVIRSKADLQGIEVGE
jgi:hypothetical protein